MNLRALSPSISRRPWVALTLCLLSFSTAAQTPPPPPATPAPTAAPAASAPVQVPREYVLGPGDLVKVTVYQNPDLSLEARVAEDGTVRYPLLGPVKLGGMSVTAAEKTIADGLRNGNFLKSPQVNVVVAQVRGHQVSVLGQVNRPGRYPIETAGLKLSDLVALAGGVTAAGSETVTLSGTRDGKAFRQEVDLPSLFSGRPGTEDPVVMNGDSIFIDRMPTFYIYGEVQRGGQLRLERGMTIMQALAAGGGLTQRGTKRGLQLHRRDAAGKVNISEPSMDTPLLPGDIIYVRESIF
ncbi:polysaccharide export protein EpsE [Rhizobacter sp. LjRoot28]|jgi:polysaccharide export outer membrane protein|uniref:polysaccharide export protein EpsE n=1 Tax=Rhizobacter sp. LjRoot28 TaxID=3342309 RepID=UPI003ECE7DD8